MKITTTFSVIAVFFIAAGASLFAILQFSPIAPDGILTTIIIITASTVILSLIFSLFTDDYSWTDRLWSVSPMVYAVLYASASGFAPLPTSASLLIVLWGLRLTYNFARRGGYTGAEDYRWKILKGKITKPLYWLVFNIFFISIYQQALFVLFTLPLNVMIHARAYTSLYAFIPVLGALIFLFIETVADQQQYLFQQSKYGIIPRKDSYSEDYKRGFRTTGLFRICRHPNYLGELGFWWCIYFLSAVGTGKLINYSIIGVSLLTLLFVGSTSFTEKITAEKYPDYSEYRKKVWPILPRIINTASVSKNADIG